MPDCKACGKWFATMEQCELCPTCERALERLRNYAAPVVHGRWDVEIDALGREYTVCPVCNSNFRMKQDGGRWLRIDLRGFEYCPHCGAKMDGGADDAAD